MISSGKPPTSPQFRPAAPLGNSGALAFRTDLERELAQSCWSCKSQGSTLRMRSRDNVSDSDTGI